MQDVVTVIKALVDANWNTSNTASREPLYFKKEDVKRIDPSVKNKDYILVYNRLINSTGSSLGNASRNRDYKVTLDLWSSLSHSQLLLMRNETARIIESNVSYLYSGTQYIITIDTMQDLSEVSRELFHYVIEININIPADSI